MHLHQLVQVFRFNKWFWGVLCLLVVANILAYFLFIAQQQVKIDKLQISYRKSRTLSSTNNDLMYRKLSRTQKDIQAFKARLPASSQFTDIVVELFEALDKQGLVVAKISYKPETIAKQGLLKYTTSFMITGSYSRLKAFLADIQNSEKLLCIENFSLGNRSAEKETVDMKLTLATYFR